MTPGEWIKRGRIYAPGKPDWAKHYGLMPTPAASPRGDRIRVYFLAAGDDCFGRVAFIEVDADNPSRVAYRHPEPVLDLGEDGAFDDCGVAPSCLLDDEGRHLLYTVGFQRCEKTPLLLFAGLARREENGENFVRVSRAPILPRTASRPFMQGAPCVLKENNEYWMWHWFVSGWKNPGGKPYSEYHIGHAFSRDGLRWEMQDSPCLSPQKGEIGVARPWTIKSAAGYEMWFSSRELTAAGAPAYRSICRAVSDDGLAWRRDPSPCLTPSATGWDSEMVCYASIIESGGRRLMFYCGNGNGKTGFGWAEWKPE